MGKEVIEGQEELDDEVEETEVIEGDEDEPQAKVKKKVASLRARHALEDYFEEKKIREELDYLSDGDDKSKGGKNK